MSGEVAEATAHGDCRELATAVFGAEVARADRYAELLVTRGIEWGLLGPREADQVWERHILNCAGVSCVIGRGEYVADIGSGAGLPGIPLALAREDVRVDLVEPMARRCEFLTGVVGELELGGRVRVVRARAQEYDGEPTVVVCRAVASVAGLVTTLGPLMGLGGTSNGRGAKRLVALKGARAEVEIRQAASALRRAGLSTRVEELVLYGRRVGRCVVLWKESGACG